MRIAFVITNGPPLMGGLERLCLRFAQHLGAGPEGNRVVCRFTKARHGLREYFLDHEAPASFEHEGVKLFTLTPSWLGRHWLRPVFWLSWRKGTFWIARRLYEWALVSPLRRACEGCEVIHYFGTAQEMLGFAAHRVALEMKVPFVIEPAMHAGQWGDSWSDQLLYLTADRLLAHTRYEAEVIQSMGIQKEKIALITLGMDPASGGDALAFRSRHKITGPMVLFFGRKTAAKGLLKTLNAFEEIRRRFQGAVLVVAGPADGKQMPEPRPGVIDLDDLTEQEKQDALAACDVLCVPSEGESFGMVYFEAWSYGKPIVALDLPSLRENVAGSGGGILVGGDPQELAAALAVLLENQELRYRMGLMGQAKAARHQWAHSRESYKAIMASLNESNVTS